MTSAGPPRSGAYVAGGVAADLSLSLLLGVLLVRDAPLLPESKAGWLLAALTLLPGIVQRVWFAIRWPGSDELMDAKMWVKIGALLATLAVARYAAATDLPPSVASGAIAARFIALSAYPPLWVTSIGRHVRVLAVVSVWCFGIGVVVEAPLFSGGSATLGTGVRDLLGLGAVVGVFVLLRRQARRQGEEEARIDQALAAERARIARELHDVVAHQMTGVILQAQGAAAVLETDPSRAAAALRSIEAGSRSALVEMRRLLGVLREDEEAAGTTVADEARDAPQPTLDDITDLVRAYTRSTASTGPDEDDDDGFDPDELLDRPLGVTVKRTVVRIDISDGADAAPPGVQASAHRIVREAFTNIARHVGRASVDVRIRRSGDDLVVRVCNGPSVEPPSAEIVGAGLGLRGMRERAESLGGTFHAGPTDDGWEVRATLPFERTPAANRAAASAGQTPNP